MTSTKQKDQPKAKPLRVLGKWVEGKGGSIQAAKALPVGDSMVRHMLSGNRAISTDVAIAVERDTNGAITRAQLLPAVFAPFKPRVSKSA